MKIDSLPLGYLGTNCYIVSDETTKIGIIFDPGGETNKIQAYLDAAGIKPAAICLTHGHFDHVMAVPALCEKYHIETYAHASDEVYVIDPMSAPAGHGYGQKSFSYDHYIKEGDVLSFGPLMLTVLETPGHTEGSVCFYNESEKILISGDTLFAGTYGRTDLGGGNFDKLRDSIVHKLFLLPDDVHVYPGHMEETTIGIEKRTNPICN